MSAGTLISNSANTAIGSFMKRVFKAESFQQSARSSFKFLGGGPLRFKSYLQILVLRWADAARPSEDIDS